MRVVRLAGDAAAGIQGALRRFTYLYAVGGPVGVVYAFRLARIKRRMATVSGYIANEKENHRLALAALNYEITQLVARQQSTSQAAAQFWLDCEKKAGVQP